jgi:peroxiredoxin Q/BCP
MAFFGFLTSFLRGEPLAVGADAPIVSGVTDSGETLNLGDLYKANKYTLVFFYPKAGTTGCTKQSCSVRDGFEALSKKGVAVVGVSTDKMEKQRQFKEENKFPYPLIADTDMKVVKAFGQSGVQFASREAYLIKGGKVVYHDKNVTDKQAENVLAFLAKSGE